jgi:DTW domain-containing protein YfiP
MFGYFLLDFIPEVRSDPFVNQQARFVLTDGDWDELKKLRPIGIA